MYLKYTMDQLCQPMDLAEDIPQNHLVRIVNIAVNRLDDKIFASAYPGGGRDSYHPKMLTKFDPKGGQPVMTMTEVVGYCKESGLELDKLAIQRDSPLS